MNLCQNKYLFFVSIIADFYINQRLQVYGYFYHTFISLCFKTKIKYYEGRADGLSGKIA